MTTITTRASKTTDLTHNELDANFNAESVSVATTPFDVDNTHNNALLECTSSADAVRLPDATTMSTTSSSSGSDTGEFTVWIRNDTTTTLTVSLTTATDVLDTVANGTDVLDIGEVKGFKLNVSSNGYVSFANSNPLEVTTTGSQTLTNKTLTSPVLTTPQLNDTSADHQYITAVSELSADRTVTMPLLTGDDEFVFKDHSQILTNKTINSAIGIGQTQYKESTSNKNWASDTTLANIDDLVFTNVAVGTYLVEYFLYGNVGGGDMKFDWSLTNATELRTYCSAVDGSKVTESIISVVTWNFTGLTASAELGIQLKASITTTNATNSIALQMAQNSSSGTVLQILADSIASITRIS